MSSDLDEFHESDRDASVGARETQSCVLAEQTPLLVAALKRERQRVRWLEAVIITFVITFVAYISWNLFRVIF